MTTPGSARAADPFDLATVAWQFNEAVSLLREARLFVPSVSTAGDIDEALPAIQAALVAVMAEVSERTKP